MVEAERAFLVGGVGVIAPVNLGFINGMTAHDYSLHNFAIATFDWGVWDRRSHTDLQTQL